MLAIKRLLLAICEDNGIVAFCLFYFLKIYWISCRKNDNSYSAERDKRQVLIEVKINYLVWFQQALPFNIHLFFFFFLVITLQNFFSTVRKNSTPLLLNPWSLC